MLNSEPTRPFKIKRVQIGLNVLGQVAATLMIVAMINYVGFNHFKRWDFSRDRKYALSDTTIHLLKELKKPAKILVFFSPGSIVYADVLNLLKEVQYAGKKKVEIEYIDPFRNFTRARQLQDKYKFGANENVLIVDYDGRVKFVTAPELVEVDNSGAELGQQARIEAFKGEQALASALLEVSEARQNSVLYITGHGEMDLSGDELTNAKTLIERQNIKLTAVNLANVDTISPDAKAILIQHPKYDFSDREILLLQGYWKNKGRLMILLHPGSSTPKLSAFLYGMGVAPREDRVLKTMDLGPLGKGIMRQVPAVCVPGAQITKRLKDATLMFSGETESLGIDAERVRSSGIVLEPLARAPDGFWGSTDYNSDNIFFNPKTDHAPPLTVAVAVEKGALNDTRLQVNSSRMIVVGNSDFLANQALTQVNLDFALSGLNWLLDRSELTGISPKVAHMFTLSLTEAQTSNLLLLVVIVIPCCAGVIGGLVLLRRRS